MWKLNSCYTHLHHCRQPGHLKYIIPSLPPFFSSSSSSTSCIVSRLHKHRLFHLKHEDFSGNSRRYSNPRLAWSLNHIIVWWYLFTRLYSLDGLKVVKCYQKRKKLIQNLHTNLWLYVKFKIHTVLITPIYWVYIDKYAHTPINVKFVKMATL